jgi:MarR family transcriptional regulator, transcriptional regulator for hemolysin
MSATKPPYPTPETAFLSDLSTVSRRLRTVFDQLVRQRGLTLARARALLHIAGTPHVNQSELAAQLEVEKPTVVRLLDGLEKQGLILRCAAAGDRRANHIVLTEAAQRQVAEIEALIAELGRSVLGEIEPQEREVASQVLRRVAAGLDRLG